MNEEQDLMNQIRSGNDEAFSQLVEDMLTPAYKTAFLMLRSKELAEDALQNALEDCYISIIRNKEIRNFKAWFYRIIYLRSIDIYRKNSKNLATDIENNPEAIAKLQSESAQQKAINNESMKEMLRLISTLPKDQSIPILLYYFEDLSVKEISAILNEKSNTVKTRLSRGRKKLAKEIQGKSNYLDGGQIL